jgi:hypothetical protein
VSITNLYYYSGAGNDLLQFIYNIQGLTKLRLTGNDVIATTKEYDDPVINLISDYKEAVFMYFTTRKDVSAGGGYNFEIHRLALDGTETKSNITTLFDLFHSSVCTFSSGSKIYYVVLNYLIFHETSNTDLKITKIQGVGTETCASATAILVEDENFAFITTKKHVYVINIAQANDAAKA